MHLKSTDVAVSINTPAEVRPALGAPFKAQSGLTGKTPADLIFYFATDKASLAREFSALSRAAESLKPGGRLWIAYPKGKAVKTDLNRDVLRMFLKERGWQAVALVAVNDTWAAMRFKPA